MPKGAREGESYRNVDQRMRTARGLKRKLDLLYRQLKQLPRGSQERFVITRKIKRLRAGKKP